MKKWLIMLLTLALMAPLFTGFAAVANAAAGKDADEAEETAEDAAEAGETDGAAEPAEEVDIADLDRIGEETEEGYKIILTNDTGTDIKGLNIQKTTDATWTWSAELLADGDKFENGETALFCYTPGEGEDEETTYNLQVVFTDWTVGYLHYVALSDMEQAVVERAVNSLPYLVYTSLASGEEIDTAAAEQKAFEGELAAGMWDAVINKGSSSSSSGSSKSSSSGSSSGGSNSAGCVGGDALFN